MAVIEGTEMVKSFGQVMALAGIDLRLESNRLVGLLGPNGAGKSTLLKVIANQLFLTSGQLQIDGQTHAQNSNLMQKVCLVTQDNPYFKDEKVAHIFKLAASIYPNWDEQFAQKLIAVFKLPLHKVYKKLSKGYRGLVNMILGLASRAEITLFDEAYVGLDAVGRERLLHILLEDYTNNPRTIVISTHFIDEVATLFEDLIVLKAGKIMLQEPMEVIERKALTIVGPEEAIRREVSSAKILHCEALGGLATVSLFAELSVEARQRLKQAGCEISHTALQKWFVHLIEQGGVA